MMATLATGGAPLVWAAPSSALNSSVSGISSPASPPATTAYPRELIVRKGIESLEDLRGKSFGVQSIGGGFWLSTMGAFEALRSIADKYKLNMRVLGDTGTHDPGAAYRQRRCHDGAVQLRRHRQARRRPILGRCRHSEIVFQVTVMCALKDSSSITHETNGQFDQRFVDSLIYILDPANKRDVARYSKKISG